MLKKDDFELFLEQVNGVLVIDEKAEVIYMNRQCADYIHADIEKDIGKPVEEVFPPSKMRDCLNNATSPVLQFYFTEGRASASLDVPIKKDGKVIGVFEYDLFQDFEFLTPFMEHYSSAADAELKYYKEEIKKLQSAKYSIDNIIGMSESIKMLKRQIQYAANYTSTILISGETGTGKELVAHAIHNLSTRRAQNFIRINAASIPENLAESELFGYQEGSFTGAKKGGSKGKFQLADKGTLFIDEIDKIPFSIQSKLLRALQEREIDPIGGTKSIPVDVRILVATNQDLLRMVKDGTFREDLYYRLNVVEIRTTPLRGRREDIPLLVEDFKQKLNASTGLSISDMTPEAMQALFAYSWPGNVRELYNVLERAMHNTAGGLIGRKHLSFRADIHKSSVSFQYDNPIEWAKREAEKEVITQALMECKGSRTKTAAMLRISRALLFQKMRRLGLQRESWNADA